MQSSLDVGDYWPGCAALRSHPGVGFGVGHGRIQPRLQVPGEVVPVLVLNLRRPARAAAGDRAHLLARPPRALLVAQNHEGVLMLLWAIQKSGWSFTAAR